MTGRVAWGQFAPQELMAPVVKKLGVLLSTPPDTVPFQQALEAISLALDRGERVFAYCLDDGVAGISDARLQAMRGRGLVLYGCAYAAHRRGISINEQAVFGGLGALGDLFAGTDEFLEGGVAGRMKRRVLIVTEADPRISGRVAEAVRVTAGLVAHPHLDVRLALCGPACAAMREDVSELVDGDLIEQYLPALMREQGRVLAVGSVVEISTSADRIVRL